MKSACVLVLLLVLSLAPVHGNDDPAVPDTSKVGALVRDGAAALQAGRSRAALKKFRLADELAQGRSWNALAGASSASLQIGKAGRAREYAERLLDLDQSANKKGTALHLLGVSLAKLNQLPEAEDALTESLALRPEKPLQTRTSLVSVLCRLDKHDQAMDLLDEDGLCAEASENPDAVDGGGPVHFEVDGEITEPIKLSGSIPEYPEQDRLARIEGTVVLDSLIGADGSIHCVKVLDGPTPALSCAAAIAVMSWKFQPSALDGEPVDVYYNLTVRFRLR